MNGHWDDGFDWVLPGLVSVTREGSLGPLTRYMVRARVTGDRRRYQWFLQRKRLGDRDWFSLTASIFSRDFGTAEEARDDCVHAVMGLQMRGELVQGEASS